MLLPNQNCILVSRQGNDIYGQPVPGRRSRERCSVVKLEVASEKTSVRTDSSASRGNAHEFQSDAVLLLPAKTIAKINDILIVRGHSLKITMMHPRYNVLGELDHQEVAADVWAEEEDEQ